jgi:fused signal recognition particle receptor
MLREKGPTRVPFVIVFIGVNGTGKTTTIAKVAHLIVQAGFTAVLAGSDTFRAGSIEQLEGHGRRLGLRVIKHAYGADAAAVAFDAVSHAKANGINAVLVDTAGRMQTNRNLIDQMKKIVRVAKPDLVLLVVDALTGNDAIEQGRVFDEAVGVDGIILTKLDADAKGGAAISISFTTKKPIAFFGTGQAYTDLATFDPDYILTKMGLHVDEGPASVGR